MRMAHPGHKQAWCDALPVSMRLLGWPEEACQAAGQYAHQVRWAYTGRAWLSYTEEVDRFLERQTLRSAQVLIAHFPRRMGVGRQLNIMA